MAEAVIGALRVVLGMDSARFEKGLKDARNSANGFVKQMSSIAAGIGLERALTSAVEAVVGSFKKAITEAERFGEMAQQFGVPVEELSKLSHAAKLSGVDVNSLGTGLQRLARSMVDAADGTGPAADTFRALGITVRDSITGELKTSEQVLLEVSEKFAGMQDGAAKTAAAIAIFGRSGAQLIPMLNQGREAIAAASEEAEKFGIVITERTAVAADNFSDTIEKLGKVWQGVMLRAMEESLPVLQSIADAMLNTAKETNANIVVGDMFAKGIFNISQAVVQAVGEIKLLQSAIATLGTLASEFVTGRWAGLTETFMRGREEIANIRGATAALQKQMQDTFTTVPVGQSMFGDFNATLGNTNKEAGALPEKLGKIKRSYSELSDQIKNSAELGDDIRKSLLTPFQEIEMQMVKVQFAFDTGAISAETFAAKMQALGLQMSAAWGSAMGSLAGSIQTAFQNIAGENKEMLAIAKIAGAAEALINTFVAQSKALAQGGIFGVAAAAAILAQGLGIVAAIKSVDVGGFAKGGSFTVGGAGGIDSQRVMMNLSPGERVDVHKPSNAGNRDLVVRGIRPRDLFTGEMVREMVLQFDDWVKHGGTGMRHER